MALTDKDLKRLRFTADFATGIGEDLVLATREVQALIARLDAAEKYIELVTEGENLGAFDAAAFMGWIEASGKRLKNL